MKTKYVIWVALIVIGLLCLVTADILGMAIYGNTTGQTQVCQQGIGIKICIIKKPNE